MFGPDPTTKKAGSDKKKKVKKNPNEGGFGDEPNENIYQYFNFTYDFIKKYTKQHKNVLVHCYAGISRSSTIILNYIIKDQYLNNINTYKEKPEDVVNHVLSYSKQRRYFINPNNGFLEQLKYAAKNYRDNKFIL